ncbi:MAG: hypothetical protein ACKPKO_44995, partial [Candidatus Fonsibacter sp.]
PVHIYYSIYSIPFNHFTLDVENRSFCFCDVVRKRITNYRLLFLKSRYFERGNSKSRFFIFEKYHIIGKSNYVRGEQC